MSDRTALLSVPDDEEQSVSQTRLSEDSYSKLGSQNTGGCILAYHEILPVISEYRYRVTNGQFKEHLALLSSAPLRSITKGDLPFITFDDGHRSNFEQAFPLLEQFGQKATFFVLAGCIGSDDKYISWEQARQLVAAGHRVESHGWCHRLLTQCGHADLERELTQSKREIEDRLGVEVAAISTPGGRWDDRVVKACARAGYKYLFHSNPWIPVSSQQGVSLLGRHMITGHMGPKELAKLVQVGGIRRLYCRIRYGTKELVRAMLGDRFYHTIWCWFANWKPGEGTELEIEALRKNGRDSYHL